MAGISQRQTRAKQAHKDTQWHKDATKDTQRSPNSVLDISCNCKEWPRGNVPASRDAMGHNSSLWRETKGF